VLEEDDDGEGLWHAGRVEFGEPEGGFAKLAMFLLGVGKPLHKAVLVNMLDAPATFARIE
jgi:hypothetical protein